MSGKMIVISGPSGVGKTTIVSHISSITGFNLELSISATTRKKRENEKNGKDYYFLSIDDFKTNIEENRFVEWEEVYQNQYYGTLISEISRITSKNSNIIFDVDAIGGLNIKRYYKKNVMAIFITPPSIEELEKRLKSRNTETEKGIIKRIKKAKLEMSYARMFDKTVVNNDLNNTLKEVEEIVKRFLTD